MMEICERPGQREQDDLNKAAQDLVEVLDQMKLKISMAESCTGGMAASALVDIAGASRVFEESYITYSDRVKHKLLGVSRQTLDQYTAVSDRTAAEMAEGVHACTGSDLAISVTGYAGPEDGEDGTPAGTVYIGTWYQNAVQTRCCHFTGDRNSCRRQAARSALEFGLERISRSE